MKKIWMTVLSLFLFVLLLGCSSEQIIEIEKEAEQTSVYEKHLDLSLAYWDIDKALENRENDKVIKTIEEKFNVTIKPANITWDDYYQKIDLWANTGTLPDVFVGAFRTEASFFQRVAEGLLHEIPQDLSKYALIIHCGGCMLNEAEMKSRLKKASEQDIPIVNYGMAIAYMNGILERSLEIFQA